MTTPTQADREAAIKLLTLVGCKAPLPGFVPELLLPITLALATARAEGRRERDAEVERLRAACESAVDEIGRLIAVVCEEDGAIADEVINGISAALATQGDDHG